MSGAETGKRYTNLHWNRRTRNEMRGYGKKKKDKKEKQKQQHWEKGLHPSASTSSIPWVLPSEPHDDRLV